MIDPIAHLSALSEKLEANEARKEYTRLKPALRDLYVSDRAAFAIAAELVKKKLRIGRRDLEVGLKPLVGDEEKKDSKPLPLARFSELIDLVEEEGEVRFLIRSDNGKEALRTEAQWEIDGQVYIPPTSALIPWLLPRAEHVRAAYATDDPAKLYVDLVAYHKSISELPREAHHKLLAAFDFHTYTLDFPGVTHSPELVFDAVAERGKSRTGKALTHVAMRGLRTETLREANIFRWSEDLGATIFFDVLNLWKKAEREKSEDILLNRLREEPRRRACSTRRKAGLRTPAILTSSAPPLSLLTSPSIGSWTPVV